MKEKIQYHHIDLVALIKNKDQNAFSYLYDKYSKVLFGIIYAIVGDYEETEDVIQTTFIKIWNSIDTYDSTKGQLFTWMLILARNTAIDFKTSKENQYVSNNVNKLNNKFTEERSFGSKPNEQAEKEYLLLIELAYTKGYTHKEISEKLEIPLETVKTKMRKTILILREQLIDKAQG